ncbi:platelet-activating factor acetylhydrolase IB subunit alpha2-like [Convolutriloba macropyga]|uniref:platelet-activating factor acetylhydrolase IB subunit alpha2-like n=1 Tax=Convolutriloba macropyga TaxID=536237 RepID=UPI003F52076B
MDPEQSMATCCPCEQPDIHGDGRWLAQHTNHLKRVTRSDPEIVFVGDTILYHLGLNSVWNKVFAPMHAVNFSIPADGTQNLLWRIRDWVASPGHDSSGDVDQMKPKVFVVHVGTEMYTYNVEEIVAGVVCVMKTLSQQYPGSKLLFMGLLPRGPKPNSLRVKNDEINKQLSLLLTEIPNSVFMDVDDLDFVQSDGQIDEGDMADFLHPTTRSYETICLKLLELFKTSLTETNLLFPNELTEAFKALVSSDDEK